MAKKGLIWGTAQAVVADGDEEALLRQIAGADDAAYDKRSPARQAGSPEPEGSIIRDTGVSLGKFVTNTGQALYGLADLGTRYGVMGTRPMGAPGLDETLRAHGVAPDFKRTNDFLTSLASEKYQDQQAALDAIRSDQDGWAGVWDEAKQSAKFLTSNPYLLTQKVVESAGSMLVPMGASRGVLSAAAQSVERAALREAALNSSKLGITTGAEAQKFAAQKVAEYLESVGADRLARATAAGTEALQSIGQASQGLREKIEELDISPEAKAELLRRAEVRALPIVALIAAPSYALGGLESRFARAATSPGSRTGAVLKGVGQEGLEEGLQAFPETIGTNFGEQAFNPNAKLLDGLGRSISEGALAGSIAGGAMGGITHRGRKAPPPAGQQTPADQYTPPAAANDADLSAPAPSQSGIPSPANDQDYSAPEAELYKAAEALPGLIEQIKQTGRIANAGAANARAAIEDEQTAEPPAQGRAAPGIEATLAKVAEEQPTSQAKAVSLNIKQFGDHPEGHAVIVLDKTRPDLHGQPGVITGPSTVWVGGANFAIQPNTRFAVPSREQMEVLPREWRPFTKEEIAAMRSSNTDSPAAPDPDVAAAIAKAAEVTAASAEPAPAQAQPAQPEKPVEKAAPAAKKAKAAEPPPKPQKDDPNKVYATPDGAPPQQQGAAETGTRGVDVPFYFSDWLGTRGMSMSDFSALPKADADTVRGEYAKYKDEFVAPAKADKQTDGQPAEAAPKAAKPKKGKGKVKVEALPDGDRVVVISGQYAPSGNPASLAITTDGETVKNAIVTGPDGFHPLEIPEGATIKSIVDSNKRTFLTDDAARAIAISRAEEKSRQEANAPKKALTAAIKEITDQMFSEEDRVNAELSEKFGLPQNSVKLTDVPEVFKAQTGIIESIFPVQVQFYEPLNQQTDEAFEGFYRKSEPGKVYVSTRVENPFMFVAGHEFAHSIEKRAPALWREFSKRVMEFKDTKGMMEQVRILRADLKMEAESAYHARLSRGVDKGVAKRMMNAALDPKNQAKVIESELLADLIGSMWLRPSFWSKLNAISKPEAKGVIARMLEKLQEFLSDLKSRISSRGLRGGKAFKQVTEVERAVVDLLADYAKIRDRRISGERADARQWWEEKADSDTKFSELSRALQDRWVDTYEQYADGDIDVDSLIKTIDSIEDSHRRNEAVRRSEERRANEKLPDEAGGIDLSRKSSGSADDDISLSRKRNDSPVRHLDLLETKSDGVRRSVDEIAQLLDSVTGNVNREEESHKDSAALERATEQAEAEFLFQKDITPAALEWYDENFAEALDIMERDHPSLSGNKRRLLFTVVLGIQSQQTAVDENWKFAVRGYEAFDENGLLPEENPDTNGQWGGGMGAGINKARHFAMLNNMIADLGYDGALDWLFSAHTVEELREARVSRWGDYSSKSPGISGKKDDTALGTIIFGPKAGMFAQNLNGIGEATIDKWAHRGFMRWFGQAANEKGEAVESPNDSQRIAAQKIMRTIAERHGYNPWQVQAALWFFEQSLYRHLGAKGVANEDDANDFAESARRLAAEASKPGRLGRGDTGNVADIEGRGRDNPDGRNAQADETNEDSEPTDGAQTADDYDPLEGVALSRKSRLENTPAGADALSKIGVQPNNLTVAQRLRAIAATGKERMIQGIFDRYYSLRKLDPYAYVLARLSGATDGALESILRYGTVYLDKDGALDVKMDGGFAKVLSELGEDEYQDWANWMIGNRAAQLYTEGRENLFTPDNIRALQNLIIGNDSKGRPRAATYTKARREFQRMNRAVLKVALDTGTISNEVYQKLAADENYIPFFRLSETDEGIEGPSLSTALVNQQAVFRLKGGTANVADPIANIMVNWSHILSASMKNQAALYSLAEMEKVGAATRLQNRKQAAADDNVARVMSAGKEFIYRIDDPLLAEAVMALDPVPSSWLAKTMAPLKNLFTKATTVTPHFKVNNLIRDAVAGVAVNPISYNPFANVMQGWNLLAEDGQRAASMLAGGGSIMFGTFSDNDRADHLNRLVRAGVPGTTVMDLSNPASFIKQVYGKYHELGNRMENVTRAAVYDQNVKSGISHLEASFLARDSMDFSLGGSWGAIRFLTQTVPFFNARLQGLYKLGRGAAETPARFSAVLATIALASIALMLAYRDDDDWKQREEWDRDNFWWFKIGDTAFRIPKPFEIGAIGTAVERTLELAADDGPEFGEFAKRMLALAGNQLSLNPVPQLAKPLAELAMNSNWFTGADIESQMMERVSKENRVGNQTTFVSQLVGKIASSGDVGLSPVQIDHLVKGYLSSVGLFAFQAADTLIGPAADMPSKPTGKNIAGIPESAFLGLAKSLPQDQSRYLTMFYNNQRELSMLKADLDLLRKRGDVEGYEKKAADREFDIGMQGPYQATAGRLSDIGEKVRRIIADKDMSPDEKREMIDELYATRNEVAKNIELARKGAKR